MGMLLLDNLYYMPSTRCLVILYFACAFFFLLLFFWHEKGTKCPDWQSAHTWGCAWPNWSLQEYFCYWVTLASCTSGCFSSGNGFESSERDFVISLLKGNLHSTHTCQQTKTHVVKQSSQSVFHLHRAVFSQWKSDTTVYFLVSLFLSPPPPPFSFFSCWLVLISFCFFSLVFLVCSSAPVSMKIQPLNQTALMVSWERPLTVYHPPITSYMVSYSWVKRDVADEKTFTKTGDQSMVSVAV